MGIAAKVKAGLVSEPCDAMVMVSVFGADGNFFI